MDYFNFSAALPQHTSSANTQRAYYRWIDRYLVEVGKIKPLAGEDRLQRMGRLHVTTLLRVLVPEKFQNWLQRLAKNDHGRQSLDQARAAVVTLSELAAAANVLTDAQFAAIRAIKVPAVRRAPAPDRLLNTDELRRLIAAAREMAQTPEQSVRNHLVVLLLCTMGLRREELSALKWADVVVVSGKVALKIETNALEIPRSVLTTMDRWRNLITESGAAPTPASPLIRRIWKGGRIAKVGLSPDGIWLVVRDAAQQAQLEHVTPDDLRRSVAASWHKAGVPLGEISQLLRHRSVMVTERFLAKLPEPGE
jgi:integrase